MSVDSAALVQAAEDILALTRILKEAWLFGKLQTVGTSEAEKRTGEASAKVFEGLNRLSVAKTLGGLGQAEQPPVENEALRKDEHMSGT